MEDFFSRKISTLWGIVILLILTGAVGIFILRQLDGLVSARNQIIERNINI